MSLSEYATSRYICNNWMVRKLTGNDEGKLTEKHLNIAIDIINKYFIVGLLKETIQTMERIEKFFQWKFRVNPENQEKCREKLIKRGSNSNSRNKPENPKPGDESYNLIAAQNLFDIKLYEHIEKLFKEQENFFSHIPDCYRKVDATCSKCVPPTFPALTKENYVIRNNNKYN